MVDQTLTIYFVVLKHSSIVGHTNAKRQVVFTSQYLQGKCIQLPIHTSRVWVNVLYGDVQVMTTSYPYEDISRIYVKSIHETLVYPSYISCNG